MPTAKTRLHGDAIPETEVVSLRMDGQLIECVRDRAMEEGRSLSGTIVSLVRERLEAYRATHDNVRPITGWLASRGSTSDQRSFRAGRRAVSARLRASVKRRAKHT